MNLKMKQLPISERPYEKLELYGADKLSNSELLAIIIKTGTKQDTAINLAQKILNINNTEQNTLRFLQNISVQEFTKIKGIGRVKAIQLKAVAEIAKRMSMPINSFKIKIKQPKDVYNLIKEELRYEKREIVKLLILNSKNIVLKILDVSFGGTNFASLEPREVLLEPIKMQAPKIILVHNHPSGDPNPSKEDYRITDRIYEVADLMGIELLDHIIIADDNFQSLFNNLEKKK